MGRNEQKYVNTVIESKLDGKLYRPFFVAKMGYHLGNK